MPVEALCLQITFKTALIIKLVKPRMLVNPIMLDCHGRCSNRLATYTNTASAISALCLSVIFAQRVNDVDVTYVLLNRNSVGCVHHIRCGVLIHEHCQLTSYSKAISQHRESVQLCLVCVARLAKDTYLFR